MEVKTVAVLGAGLMGHGIAQVAAQVAKYEVSLRDVKQEFLDKGMNMIKNSLQSFLKKGKISEKEVDETLKRIYACMRIHIHRKCYLQSARTHKVGSLVFTKSLTS